ncbi:MAG: hypothetical protein AMS20_00255 [Gemmatimonas sp. SG8_28]|nr:MAG: hypothetical protein AMS20_00255 [Gemmatimonas sp. SG8_28]
MALAPPGWSVDSDRARGMPGTELADPEELVSFVKHTCWERWEDANRAWWRQVEENVRMLSGAQYDYFIETLGESIDLSRWFLSPDERWRQSPVFNWLQHYYKLTLSKLTENLPMVTFMPATADYTDAVTARVMDPIWRYEWTQMAMPQKMFFLYGWVIAAARAVTKLRWDPDRGPLQEFRGPAIFEQLSQSGVMQERTISDAPWHKVGDNFEPNILKDAEGNPIVGPEGEPRFGDPYTTRVGDLTLDVITPTSLIVPHGPEMFWEKPWYTHKYLVPVEDIERRFNVRLEPDEISTDDDLALKLAYGSNYGMPDHAIYSHGLGSVQGEVLKGYVEVWEHWRPCIPSHHTQSRGRLTLVCKERTVLYDDINPFWVDQQHENAIIPFDAFDSIPVPWRNEGAGDLEILNPIQRAFNRRMHGSLDSADFHEQPITFYNENALDDEQIAKLQIPGSYVAANFSVGEPFKRFDAPGLPRGSIEMADRLQSWMQMLGSQPFGAEGMPVTPDASGELQREVRFDTDRVWGATVRYHSYVWANIAQKMAGILSACMDDQRLLSLSGQDQAPEFIMVQPEMFQGRVNVYPNPESQVLESRQERQNRVIALVGAQLIAPDAALRVLNYPDVNRAIKPGGGGPAYAMAQQEHLELLVGQLSPVLPEHDHMLHMAVHLEYMQTVAFRDLDPQAQQLFRTHMLFHQMMMAGQVAQMAGAGGDQEQQEGAPNEAAGPPGQGQGAPLPGADAAAPGQADPGRASLQVI